MPALLFAGLDSTAAAGSSLSLQLLARLVRYLLRYLHRYTTVTYSTQL